MGALDANKNRMLRNVSKAQGSTPAPECPICMEPITGKLIACPKEDKHIFCQPCIQNHVWTKHNRGQEVGCPLCRENIKLMDEIVAEARRLAFASASSST